jgi:hypothetical protein
VALLLFKLAVHDILDIANFFKQLCCLLMHPDGRFLLQHTNKR